VQNENGAYVGIRAQPIPRLCLSMYYDQFAHPQPTYLLPAPSHGNDFLALAECKLTEHYEITFRFKRKDMPSALDGNDLYGRFMKGTISHIQQNYRLTGDFISSSSYGVSSRVEWVSINYGGIQNTEQGVLMSQAVTWKNLIRSQFKHGLLSSRRIHTIHRSMSLKMRFPELMPIRHSMDAACGGILYCDIRSFQNVYAAKYAQTVKEGVKSIGTGNDEISGDSQSVMSAQVDVQF